MALMLHELYANAGQEINPLRVRVIVKQGCYLVLKGQGSYGQLEPAVFANAINSPGDRSTAAGAKQYLIPALYPEG
jgi:hypothetical protein